MNLNQNEEPSWDSLRDFLRIQLRHVMLEMPSGGIIVKECPKCKTRIPIMVEKVCGEDQIVDVFFGHIYDVYFELALMYAETED